MLNLKSRLKNAIQSAVQVTSSTVKGDVWDVYQNKKEQHINNVQKERSITMAKSVLGVAYLLLNKDAREQSFVIGNTVSSELFGGIDNPFKSILKLAINSGDLLSARALNDIDNLTYRAVMEDTLKLTSTLTGYSIEEILNLKYNYNSIDAPTGTEVIYMDKKVQPKGDFKVPEDSTNTEVNKILEQIKEFKFETDDELDTRPLKEASLTGYDKNCDAYKELVIPSLHARILLAHANWVQGIAPNKFELIVKDLNTISADLTPAFSEFSDNLENIKIEDKELPSLYNEDGSIKLNR